VAVDTRDKRASVLGLGLASLLVLPSPTALDQGDRQQVSYSYRGIAASAPVSVTPASYTYTATWQATATYVATSQVTSTYAATWQTTATYSAEWD
jgi:hypothetical protein